MRRQRWPILFDDEQPEAAKARRASVVKPAPRSVNAAHTARTGGTTVGDPVHSFRTLLHDLATVHRNTVALRLPGIETFRLLGVWLPFSQ